MPPAVEKHINTHIQMTGSGKISLNFYNNK